MPTTPGARDQRLTNEGCTALPPLRLEPRARSRIRAANARHGRRIAVLDDDPTGSQSVHDVSVVTAIDSEAMARGLFEPGSTCFVLTNTRSLPEPEAVALNVTAGRALFDLSERMQAPIDVISRSDSTLRGHVMAEIRALDSVRRQATGHGFDAVLLVPAYLEAGRCTVDDVHWALVAGDWMPVGETEFAQDTSFGYATSNLREFVADKSGGDIAVDEVHSIGLEDIRVGGPARVAEILRRVTKGAFVVINAATYADLDIVVLGLNDAQEQGLSFLYRTGPSFVRALAGIEPREPLTAADLWPAGHPGGHGVVVVGSHVGLTDRQLQTVRVLGDFTELEVDVAAVVDPARRSAHVADVTRAAVSALVDSDVLLVTTRVVARGTDATDSLRMARVISAGVAGVIRGIRAARPAWVVAKGGITSHDVAVHGLGIRRATVLGQLLPGMVTVMRPIEAAPEAIGTPFVVFAGNVGDDSTLATVVDLLRMAS